MNRITNGWINGFIGMFIFSASLPATRMAVSGFSPIFTTSMRATIAASLALFFILLYREAKPHKSDLLSLSIVALGVVVGFPLLTALALQYITSAQSLVFIGLLPLSTATFGVLRATERPRWTFWVFSILGSSLVVGYALSQGYDTSLIGNGYMFAAIIVCGLGYAEGAKLSRKLGGWQVISWALVLALPVMGIVAVFSLPSSVAHISTSAWIGLAYVSLFSMFIGFIFWYRGLAQGGIAAVGQLQLLQPFFGLILAASLLNEKIDPIMIVITVGVILSVIASKKFA
jgi:drug/metabolite transporter (DMT)-like permease